MVLDLTRLDTAETRHARAPFAYVVAWQLLGLADQAVLLEDFPRYRGAGFFPYLADDCGPAVQALVEELRSPAFAQAVGQGLGLEGLDRQPALVTLCRSVNLRHGTLHTDSRSKLATALLYLNPGWEHGSAGCLRLLARGDDIQALLAPEIPPLYGTLVAFARNERSWHGHLPFEGWRPAVQIAWLASQADLERKTRRGALARWLKPLLGRLDRLWGAGRRDDARHE